MPKMSGRVASPFGIPFSHGARKGAKHSEYARKGERWAKGERRLLFPMVQDLSHLCGTRTAIPRNQSGRVASLFRSCDRTRVPSTQNMLPRLESIMMEFIKLSSIGPTKANPVSWYGSSCSAEMTRILHHGKKEPMFPPAS